MPEASHEEIKDAADPGPPARVVYFAYGSNMATARLRRRTPSCERLGVASLPGHELRFHKRSRKDGSAKCDAFATGDDSRVIGVLFSFDPPERAVLDEAEGAGKGYDAKTVTVIDDHGRSVGALTYLASSDAIVANLKPYTWYKDHVLAGSAEHGLPAGYVAKYIDGVEAVEDLNRERDREERATLLDSGG